MAGLSGARFKRPDAPSPGGSSVHSSLPASPTASPAATAQAEAQAPTMGSLAPATPAAQADIHRILAQHGIENPNPALVASLQASLQHKPPHPAAPPHSKPPPRRGPAARRAWVRALADVRERVEEEVKGIRPSLPAGVRVTIGCRPSVGLPFVVVDVPGMSLLRVWVKRGYGERTEASEQGENESGQTGQGQEGHGGRVLWYARPAKGVRAAARGRGLAAVEGIREEVERGAKGVREVVGAWVDAAPREGEGDKRGRGGRDETGSPRSPARKRARSDGDSDDSSDDSPRPRPAAGGRKAKTKAGNSSKPKASKVGAGGSRKAERSSKPKTPKPKAAKTPAQPDADGSWSSNAPLRTIIPPAPKPLSKKLVKRSKAAAASKPPVARKSKTISKRASPRPKSPKSKRIPKVPDEEDGTGSKKNALVIELDGDNVDAKGDKQKTKEKGKQGRVVEVVAEGGPETGPIPSPRAGRIEHVVAAGGGRTPAPLASPASQGRRVVQVVAGGGPASPIARPPARDSPRKSKKIAKRTVVRSPSPFAPKSSTARETGFQEPETPEMVGAGPEETLTTPEAAGAPLIVDMEDGELSAQGMLMETVVAHGSAHPSDRPAGKPADKVEGVDEATLLPPAVDDPGEPATGDVRDTQGLDAPALSSAEAGSFGSLAGSGYPPSVLGIGAETPTGIGGGEGVGGGGCRNENGDLDAARAKGDGEVDEEDAQVERVAPVALVAPVAPVAKTRPASRKLVRRPRPRFAPMDK